MKVALTALALLCRVALPFGVALLAGCGGDPPAVVRVEVQPSAALLVGVGERKQLTAVAYDANNNPIPGVAVSWKAMSPSVVSVDSAGLATAVAASGASQIEATVGSVSAPPVLAVVTSLAAGTVLVPDAQVVVDPAPTDPAASPAFGNTYTVTLSGRPPAVGELLLGSESKPIAGRVVSVTPSGSNTAVTLQMVSIREAFPNLDLRETFDLSKAAVQITDEAAAVYDMARTGNTFTFKPKATPGPLSGRMRGLATATADPAIPNAFDCESTVSGAAGSPPPITLDVAPPLSITIKPTFDLAYSAANGLQKLAVNANPKFALEGGVTATAAFEGKVDCKRELFTYAIPVGGPLSLFVGGQIPIGMGVTLSGKVTTASLSASLKTEVTGDLVLGIDCPNEGVCSLMRRLDLKRPTITPRLAAQFGAQGVRLEPEVEIYGYAEATVGAAWLKKLRLTLLEATAGGKVAGSFALPVAQMGDADYKSDYKVSLEGSAGLSGKLNGRLAEALARLGLKEIVGAKLTVSVPLASSPEGTLVATVGAFTAGAPVHLTLHLDAGTASPFGAYNVKEVVLMRRVDGLANVIARSTAGDGQVDFAFDWVADRAGNTKELFAFAVTKLLPFDLFALELATATTIDALPLVNAASCGTAVVGEPMLCTLTGTNLPVSASMTGTNCSPTPMTARAGGTGTQRQFTCIPQSVGPIAVTYSVLGASGSPLVVASPVAQLPSPLTTVSAVSCTPPAAAQLMACTVTGTNLPDSGMTLSASDCNPTVMPQQAGGLATSRTFGCVPIGAGALNITGLAVPGFSGSLPVLPSYSVLPAPLPAVTGLACVNPIVGQTMTCTITGANIGQLNIGVAVVNITAPGAVCPSVTQVGIATSTQRSFTCVPAFAGLADVQLQDGSTGGFLFARFITVGLPDNVTALADIFVNNAPLSSTRWMEPAGGSVVGSSGIYINGSASTSGKFSVSGGSIVLEFNRQFDLGTTYVGIVDATSGGGVFGGTGSNGLFVNGTGEFNLPTTRVGSAGQDQLVYRMTIAGTSITLERGVDWAHLSERVTGTLASAIAGRTFYVVANGGFGWITVKSDAAFARPNAYVTFITTQGCGAAPPFAPNVRLNWNPLVDASRYVILKNAQEASQSTDAPGNWTDTTLTSANSGQFIYYSMKARNAIGDGPDPPVVAMTIRTCP